MPLTYDNLLQEARNAIPEFDTEYNQLLNQDLFDEQAGNHIVFGYAFTPLLVNAIKNHTEPLEAKMIDFLERMASSSDRYVVEVCDQSVLEVLNDEFEDDQLRKILKKETLVGFEALKTYMF